MLNEEEGTFRDTQVKLVGGELIRTTLNNKKLIAWCLLEN